MRFFWVIPLLMWIAAGCKVGAGSYSNAYEFDLNIEEDSLIRVVTKFKLDHNYVLPVQYIFRMEDVMINSALYGITYISISRMKIKSFLPGFKLLTVQTQLLALSQFARMDIERM